MMTTTIRLSPSEFINVMALVNGTGNADQHRAGIEALNNNPDALQHYFPGWSALPWEHIQWVNLICQVRPDLLVPFKRGEVTPADVLRAVHYELNNRPSSKPESASGPLNVTLRQLSKLMSGKPSAKRMQNKAVEFPLPNPVRSGAGQVSIYRFSELAAWVKLHFPNANLPDEQRAIEEIPQLV